MCLFSIFKAVLYLQTRIGCCNYDLLNPICARRGELITDNQKAIVQGLGNDSSTCGCADNVKNSAKDTNQISQKRNSDDRFKLVKSE